MIRHLVGMAAVVLAVAAPAAAAGEVYVSLDRTGASTRLGHTVAFRSTIANRGSAPTPPLIAHLNVLSLRTGVYVDPEDWSSHRTRYLGPIAPGGARSLTWRIKAVNAGSIAVYVAILPRSGAPVPPVTGPTLHIEIADRRTLDSGGILPLAIGVPALLVLVLLVVRTRRKRTSG
jgi:hypothetical protein